jgi:WD40 repeat protein
MIRHPFVFLIAIVGVLNSSYRSSAGDNKPQPVSEFALGPLKSLGKILDCKKTHRLMLCRKSAEVELWDTQRGIRLGEVQRLARSVEWCLASPDEKLIITGDRMPDTWNIDELDLWTNGFVPTIRVWDAQSGRIRHVIPVRDAVGHRYYTHEWSAQWLDESHLLVSRLLRPNSARTASSLKLIVIDVAVGNVVKASDEIKYGGDHVILSPDKKTALTIADNFVRRHAAGSMVDWGVRNQYSKTHVIDLKELGIVAQWGEPREKSAADWKVVFAFSVGWCLDSKRVVTIDSHWSGEEHPAPRIRVWEARTAKLLWTFAGHTHYVLDFTTTGDDRKLLTASEDRTLRVWNLASGKLEFTLSGHSAGLNKVVVLPGDKFAVSAAEEKTVKVWDLTTGKLRFDLSDHDSAVRKLTVLSANVVRTESFKGTTTDWDCSTGKRLTVTPKAPDYPRRFGSCEIIEKDGALIMHTVGKSKK